MWIYFWINLSISRLSENYPYFFSFYSWFSRVKSNFRKLDFLTSREIFCSSSSCPKHSLWIFLELFGNKNSFSFIYLFVFFLSFFFFLFLSFFTRRAHLFLSLPLCVSLFGSTLPGHVCTRKRRRPDVLPVRFVEGVAVIGVRNSRSILCEV